MRSGTPVALVLAAILAAAAPARAEAPADASVASDPSIAPPDPPLASMAFPRPPEIDSRVAFWRRVFSEVDTNGGFVHDSDQLDRIYDVVQWPEDATHGQEVARYESAKAQVQTILRRLASAPRTNLTAEEQRILALFPKGVSSKALRDAAERVRFQRGQADKFRDGLVRSGRWEQHIARAFRDRGLPGELAALPHVESSFNPAARSHAGAAGLWQFMPSTARRFRLRVNSTMDERFDPFRSTEAAADLLADNYRMLGTWPLALTAYNHGPGGMMRAVRQVGSRDIGEIVSRYDSRTFGFASQNFYAEFLAVLDLERDAPRYFGPIVRDQPSRDEVVVTRHSHSARSLAKAFGLDLGLLRELNPSLRDSVWKGRRLVPRGYALRIPEVADRPSADQVLASLPAAGPDQVDGHTHVVRRGDTLSRIARRYGVSVTALAAANDIHNPRQIRPGLRLHIPGAVEVAVAEDAAARRPPPQPVTRSYVVRPGDTLSSIAGRNGSSAKRIAAANGIRDPRSLRPGQRLEIPVSGSRSRAPTIRTYVVRRGDTLSSIARRHGTSVQSIVAANGLDGADQIRAGQRLRVPLGQGG